MYFELDTHQRVQKLADHYVITLSSKQVEEMIYTYIYIYIHRETYVAHWHDFFKNIALCRQIIQLQLSECMFLEELVSKRLYTINLENLD